MIVFNYRRCQKHFSMKEEFAGRTTNCPQCRTPLRVPIPVASPASPTAAIPQVISSVPQGLPDEEPSTLPIVVSSYIRDNLMPGERLVGITRIHPLVMVSPSILAVMSLLVILVGIILARDSVICLVVIGIPMAGIAGIFMVARQVKRLSTEYSCTDRRILIKSGLITTELREMPLAKVEALRMEQGLFGKLFGYGTIVFKGSGGTRRTCKSVEAPFDFFKRIQLQVAAVQQQR